MASISLQTNVGTSDDMSLSAAVTQGTAAPTSETFEFRWNQAATTSGWVPTRQDALRALEQFERYIEDGRFTLGTAL
jgi:hypothetical protein